MPGLTEDPDVPPRRSLRHPERLPQPLGGDARPTLEQFEGPQRPGRGTRLWWHAISLHVLGDPDGASEAQSGSAPSGTDASVRAHDGPTPAAAHRPAAADRARPRGLLGGPRGGLRHHRRGPLPVPAVQGPGLDLARFHPGPTNGEPAVAVRVRGPGGGVHQRVGGLCRRRPGRLGGRRAADRLPQAALHPGAVDRPHRGQGRRERLGGNLFRRPQEVPRPGRRPIPSPAPPWTTPAPAARRWRPIR